MSQAPIDMSLRLWSDEVALAPILRSLGPIDLVHVRGERVPSHKDAAPRIALRHYASIAREQGWHASDVDAWMHSLLAQIRDDRPLVRLFETRQIDGTFWIAILGAQVLPMPKINRHLAEQAAFLGLRVFSENYTELVDGNPSRRWFPEKPASAARTQSVQT